MPYDSHHHREPAGFSIEITPGAARKVSSFAAVLPAGTPVYVTNLPGTDVGEAMRLCRRLCDEGMRPVPHLAARGLRSRGDLAAWLDRAVGEGGAREILLIAGSGERAAGPFPDTLAVLDSGLLETAGLRGFGVAGHPEGHPNAGPAVLADALRRKQAFAAAHGFDAWIVTQFTFSAAPVLRWAETMADAGVTLPIRVGLPGPAKPATLINYARQCGAGASLRVLTRRPDVMAGLVRAWTPDAILADLTRQGLWAGRGHFAGVHLFPFGGFAKAATWATENAGRAVVHPGLNAGGGVVGLT
jgi:methylenetetrahydrofolate reductase (NADPH)